ncbi:phage tail tip lysozyme [Caballeronia sp. LZ065]|uniref:phage tail tip lysozyme n=1 Tax=Caballeronia sp. LZ065 TaxID=3038571 RepID=UPI00285B1537|nr:phage tail tip lysozyme [Caballeronia sp. LZ065]MDR5784061.1 phage tail tip lysozyme [Caballeronia sp. LZ065]
MANNLTIVISALDRTGAGFASANRNLRAIDQAMMRTSRSSQRMSAVQSFVTGATRASALSTALFAGVLGAAALVTSKILSIESAWANTVRSVSNKSLSLGIDAKQLFGIQNAAKSVGLNAEQATSSVEGVTRGYYESTQGRDPQKRMIYQAYGINGQDERGQFSSERLLEQIAAAGESVNGRNGPLARHRLFEALDAGGLEDLLNKGAGGVRDRYSRGLALAPTEDDIRHANDYAEAMSRLDAQFDKTKQSILGGLAPALTTFLEGVERVTARLNGKEYVPTRWNGQGYVPASAPDAPPAANVGDRAIDGLEKFGNFLRGNGARTNAQVGAEPNANVPRAVEFFESRGWSRAQAIGIVSNLQHESGIDPSASGDSGKAYGIAQWHADRQAAFQNWAGNWIGNSTLEQQLGFVDYELRQGGEQRAGAELETANTARQAADVVSRLYERPADADGAAAARSATAERIAGLYSGGTSQQAAAQQDQSPARADGELRVKVELGNLPKGSRAEVSGTPNVKSTVERGSTGSTSQFALGATY